MTAPRLSIIIPVLDEAAALPELLGDLAAQGGVAGEVLVVDGGSVDGTPAIAEKQLSAMPWPGRVLLSEKGRGRQMNRGAREARGRWLLFLHADSRLPGPQVLAESVARLERKRALAGDGILAGHLTLAFDLPAENRTLAFRFLEAKARSGRPWTIHGDQGFFIRRDDFRKIGGFREDLPVMEDSAFAEAVRREGEWQLLPGKILTSPRRFQREGTAPRQTLNALMVNFLANGREDFFKAVPRFYQEQSRAARLDLQPLLTMISTRVASLPLSRRWALWITTGRFVRSQIWQIGLYLDCRQQGGGASRADGRWLTRVDRWFDPLTDHWAGNLATAVLVRLWFAGTVRRRHRHSPRRRTHEADDT